MHIERMHHVSKIPIDLPVALLHISFKFDFLPSLLLDNWSSASLIKTSDDWVFDFGPADNVLGDRGMGTLSITFDLYVAYYVLLGLFV